MNKQTRYSPEVRERAVRLVFEHQEEHDSHWATIGSIASKIGCTPETLRKRVLASKHHSDWEAGIQVNATSRGQIDSCQATQMDAGCAFDRRKRAFVQPIPSGQTFA